MAFAPDPRIAEAHGMDMDHVLAALEVTNLKRMGQERTGPCPVCGGDDRFSVNIRKAQFLCRRCDAKGDQIALVMHVRGVDFAAALEFLCGERQELSPEERAARAARDAQNAARKDREEAAFRARAIADARRIWQAGLPAQGSPVVAYLALRGLGPRLWPTLPPALRYHPDLPYMVQDQAGQWIEAHRGPAMLAAIQGPDGRFAAVHRTWFDLAAPLGKIALFHPQTGVALKRKKTLGSKKAGAIRLTGSLGGSVLVMGEGIETTATAMVVAHASGLHLGAMFWAGVDLGNMAGHRQLGPGLKYAGLPDLGDDTAFLPPSGVTRLIYVMDGDSDPRDTRAKLEAGLRRAMALRPGLQGQVAVCPPGLDLNDVLLGPGGGPGDDVTAGDGA